MRKLTGQGATEYLVLLAVVLIIALVGIALLGFFPGTASDAQEQESKIYWQSASPIAISEMGARTNGNDILGETAMYLRVKNNGVYPLTITKILGNNGQSISLTCTPGGINISQQFYLAPGEEKYFGRPLEFPGTPAYQYVSFWVGSGGSSSCYLKAADSVCNPRNASTAGTMAMRNFGFEYVINVEGQQITKQQVGMKPLIIKCS